MFKFETVMGVQKLTNNIRGSQLILHCCSIHDLPKFSFRPSWLTYWAIAYQRVTEDWHFPLVNVTVHLQTPFSQLFSEFLKVYFLANYLGYAVPNYFLGATCGILIFI